MIEDVKPPIIIDPNARRDGERHADWFKRIGCGSSPITFAWLARELDVIDALPTLVRVVSELNQQNKARTARLDALEQRLAVLEAKDAK